MAIPAVAATLLVLVRALHVGAVFFPADVGQQVEQGRFELGLLRIWP
jgi:hypothetical protein